MHVCTRNNHGPEPADHFADPRSKPYWSTRAGNQKFDRLVIGEEDVVWQRIEREGTARILDELQHHVEEEGTLFELMAEHREFRPPRGCHCLGQARSMSSILPRSKLAEGKNTGLQVLEVD